MEILKRKSDRNLQKFIAMCLLVILAVSAGLYFSGCYHIKNQSSVAVSDGSIDLSEWGRANGGFISLNGNWDFYWNRWLNETDLQTGQFQPIQGKVPGVWNSYIVGGLHPSGIGKATYRLRVTGAVAGEKLSLHIQSVSTAYVAYIDDHAVASSGRLSRDGTFLPQYRNQSDDFVVPASQFDIIIQVENRVYARGGIWEAIRLGTPEDMARLTAFNIYKDCFLLGCLFVIMMTLLILFAYVRHQSYSFFLFVGALFTFIRTLLHGSYLIYTIFPTVPFDRIIRADYICNSMIPICVVCFVQLFVGGRFRRAVIVGIFAFYLAVFVFTLTAPLVFLTNLVWMYTLDFVLLGIYGTFIALKVWRKNQTGTRIVTIGSFALLLLGVVDNFYQASVIDNLAGDIFPIGYILTVLCLIFVILKKYNEYMHANLVLLRAQIRPHFIHNALNTILIISRRDPERSRDLLVNFSQYLRSCYDSENLPEQIPLKRELDHVRSYVEIEKARFGDRLQVEYHTDILGVRIPHLILQPLVENAIVHGIRPKGGGLVTIYTEKKGKHIRIGVRDNGVGFQLSAARHLDGTGIGMNNIDKRLQEICRSRLIVKQLENGGSDVYFEVEEPNYIESISNR